MQGFLLNFFLFTHSIIHFIIYLNRLNDGDGTQNRLSDEGGTVGPSHSSKRAWNLY